MRYLPEDFDASGMSAVEARKLEYFYEQFVIKRDEEYGQGHFVLACYAALPAVLTSDLLHKLWLNFKNYKSEGAPAVIHPVAPADILLSPLMEEIGFELYEMSEPVRKALLRYFKEATSDPVKNKPGFYPLSDIAEFLRDYSTYDFTPGNADDNAFREAQQWTALSYLEPCRAFAHVAQAFEKATSNAGKARYRNALEKMSSRFALNIVKDGAEVPKEFRAVTALTSVIRDVLQKRDPKRLQELIDEARAKEGLLTDAPLNKPNVITLEVPEEVGKLLSGKEEKKRPKEGGLKAFVVGIDRQTRATPSIHVSTANYFQLRLNQFFPDAEIQVPEFSSGVASREAVLEYCKQFFSNANSGDDLLFYIAADTKQTDGHCCILCPGMGEGNTVEEQIRDEEIEQLAAAASYSSLTIILQLHHAATPYWADTSQPKNIVFAAARYSDDATVFEIETEGAPGVFTYCMAEAMSESSAKISNRDLYAKALRRSEEMRGKAHENSPVSPVSHENMPQLLAHPDACERFFWQGANSTVALQNGLRHTGYLQAETTGIWNEETAKALWEFCVGNSVAFNLSKQTYLQQLASVEKTQKAQSLPIFLLLYSDPEKKLEAVEEEKELIMQTLRRLDGQVEVKTLINPSKQLVIDTLMDKNKRNRIELFYYSGLDRQGNFSLRDGVVNAFDFIKLLGYQQALKLLVSNTCRSQFFAEAVAQAGVAVSIGTKDVVDDSVAASFGKQLFDWIADGKSVYEYIVFFEGGNLAKKGKRNIFKPFIGAWFKNADKPLWEWKASDDLHRRKPGVQRVLSLLIGIDKYKGSPLGGCVYSAKHLKELLKELSNKNDEVASKVKGAGLEATEAHLLVDEDATRKNILVELFNLLTLSTPEDICVIYFAGHGQNRSHVENTLMPVDYNLVNSPNLVNTDFLKVLETSRAEADIHGQVVMILDSHTGYYKWVGENDIFLGAVRHTMQTEIPFSGGNTQSPFFYALSNILLHTNGLITYRHLLLWLRFSIQKAFPQGNEIPVLMASALNLDSYFLRKNVRNADESPVIAYNQQAARWEMLPEDFKLVTINASTYVRDYHTLETISGAKGEVSVRDNELLFMGQADGLDKNAMYRLSIQKPLLPVYWSAKSPEGEIEGQIAGLSLDAFSSWQGVTLFGKEEMAMYDDAQRLVIEGTEGYYELTYPTIEYRTEKADVRNLKINSGQYLKDAISKFSRYHYLSNLRLPQSPYKVYEPLSVRFSYQWKTDTTEGSRQGEETLVVSEESFFIRDGAIEFFPLELVVKNEEEFPVFCAIYLLSSNLAMKKITAQTLNPVLPATTATIVLDEPEFFETLLSAGLNGQLKLLASRDPVQVDFSQTAPTPQPSTR